VQRHSLILGLEISDFPKTSEVFKTSEVYNLGCHPKSEC
jgi:hypothetical protein